MSKSFKNDLTGQRFGRLTVLEFVPTQDRKSHWLCKCDCGNEKIIRDDSLKDESARSCGCLQREIAGETLIQANTKHGVANTRLYNIYKGIKSRCYNKNNACYKDYGGRNIEMCQSWLTDFTVFQEWALSHGYNDNLSIDRIDNNYGYFPENCRWVTQTIQVRNTRRNIYVDYQGEKLCLSELSERINIPIGALQARYHKGDRGDRLFRPVQIRNKNK